MPLWFSEREKNFNEKILGNTFWFHFLFPCDFLQNSVIHLFLCKILSWHSKSVKTVMKKKTICPNYIVSQCFSHLHSFC